MRLIIEITYHSSALAVSSERFPPVSMSGVEGGESRRGVKNNRRRRRYTLMCDRVYMCKHDRIDVRRRIEFYLCAFVEPWTLISRFRDIIRGGCVISCNFVLDAPQNTTYIPFYMRMCTICVLYVCSCAYTPILARECFSLLDCTSDSNATACAETDASRSSFHKNCKKIYVYFFLV